MTNKLPTEENVAAFYEKLGMTGVKATSHVDPFDPSTITFDVEFHVPNPIEFIKITILPNDFNGSMLSELESEMNKEGAVKPPFEVKEWDDFVEEAAQEEINKKLTPLERYLKTKKKVP